MKNLSSLQKLSCPHCGSAVEDLDSQDKSSSSPGVQLPPLSSRERQLVDLVRQAKSNKEIAFEMSLTVGSVKEYLHRVFKKVGVRSRTELALLKAEVEYWAPPAAAAQSQPSGGAIPSSD